MSTIKRGRPSIISKLRQKLDCKDVFPQLEIIAASANADSGISMADVLKAVKDATDLEFGAVAFRNMIRRYGRGKVRKDSVLGQLIRLTRGAPVGSCAGMVRNPHGRHGDPATRRSRIAKKAYANRIARQEAASATA